MTDLTKMHKTGCPNSIVWDIPMSLTSLASVERLTAYIWEIADVESKPVWMPVITD